MNNKKMHIILIAAIVVLLCACTCLVTIIILKKGGSYEGDVALDATPSVSETVSPSASEASVKQPNAESEDETIRQKELSNPRKDGNRLVYNIDQDNAGVDIEDEVIDAKYEDVLNSMDKGFVKATLIKNINREKESKDLTICDEILSAVNFTVAMLTLDKNFKIEITKKKIIETGDLTLEEFDAFLNQLADAFEGVDSIDGIYNITAGRFQSKSAKGKGVIIELKRKSGQDRPSFKVKSMGDKSIFIEY